MKKILILYTSIGLGHKVIAENIGYHLEQAGYEVLLHDILKVQSGQLVNFGTALHQFINRKLPWLWRFLYFYGHWPLYPFRVVLASKNYQRLKAVVDDFKPDMIISTQTTSSAIVAYMKRKGLFKGLFGIAFSDYHLHPYWLYKEAQFYLVNIEEQKVKMIKKGIKPNNIFVCGMTLKPKSAVDITSVKQKFGIKPEEKVVLLASGSLGIGPTSQDWLGLVQKLKAESKNQNLEIKLIIITGKNKELYQGLEKRKDENLIVLPFYETMSELYAITDAFITKPGGLTVAESLLWGLPLFITHFLPGQEELNVNYLSEKKLINVFLDTKENNSLINAVIEELKIGSLKQALLNNLSREVLVDPAHPGRRVTEAVKEVFHGV